MDAFVNRLLREFKLRSTPVRHQVLGVFLRSEHALSHTDIESVMDDAFDRVTLYRTLRTFLDHGIIHRVPDDGGTLKYAVCSESCSTTAGHRHNHIHFKCVECGQTNCIDVEIPSIRLPKGYRATDQNLLVQGICRACDT